MWAGPSDSFLTEYGKSDRVSLLKLGYKKTDFNFSLPDLTLVETSCHIMSCPWWVFTWEGTDDSYQQPARIWSPQTIMWVNSGMDPSPWKSQETGALANTLFAALRETSSLRHPAKGHPDFWPPEPVISLTFVAWSSLTMRLFGSCNSNGKTYIMTTEVSGWGMAKDKIIEGQDT